MHQLPFDTSFLTTRNYNRQINDISQEDVVGALEAVGIEVDNPSETIKGIATLSTHDNFTLGIGEEGRYADPTPAAELGIAEEVAFPTLAETN